tara:strand:+ start:11790 stop:11942 length:153 start_codon:yes stop_codon:yes gene_type:complete
MLNPRQYILDQTELLLKNNALKAIQLYKINKKIRYTKTVSEKLLKTAILN